MKLIKECNPQFNKENNPFSFVMIENWLKGIDLHAVYKCILITDAIKSIQK